MEIRSNVKLPKVPTLKLAKEAGLTSRFSNGRYAKAGLLAPSIAARKEMKLTAADIASRTLDSSLTPKPAAGFQP
ncbi:MAG: hypothetical protein ACHRHE_14370 [Tepidisphaerales bacterium]